MKEIKLVILLTLFGLFAGLYSANNPDESEMEKLERKKREHLEKYTLAAENVSLIHVRSFPNEDQIEKGAYLKVHKDMAVDFFSGLIYVPDNGDHKLLVFALNGEFIRCIGQKGQGPADFFHPSNVMLWKNYLVVNDVGNLRVQFIDKNGEYVKSFKTFKTYYTMEINADGMIYGIHVNKYGEKYLIDVLSQEGKLLNSFGEKSEFQMGKDTLSQYILFIDKKGYVYLASISGSKIRKFSAQGKLISEIQLKYKPILNIENMNIKLKKAKKRGYYSISDLFVSDGSIFVHVSSSPVFEIVEFDMTGKVKKVFWNQDINLRYVCDLMVKVNQGKYFFYTCHLLPERQVDIFKSK